MGIEKIVRGVSTKAQVQTSLGQIIDFGLGQGTGTGGSWATATSRFNAVASDLGLPGLAAGQDEAVARARINDVVDALGVPTDADLYLDFLNNRYFGGVPTDTHATDILALGSGGYETFAPNVLPRTDLGLLTTVGRTNKCGNWNANPVDLTGIVKSGDEAATLTLVDDSTKLAAAGLSAVCSSGMVFFVDNTAGASVSFINISGGTGNTNKHSLSGWIRGGTGALGFSGTVRPTFGASDEYVRLVRENVTPLASSNWGLSVDPGQAVYFILNQLEEGPFATDPIITEGSAVTRPGNRPVIDLTGRLGEGVAGVIAVDQLDAGSTPYLRLLEANDGTATNRISVARSGGNIIVQVMAGAVSQAVVNAGAVALPAGRLTVAFACGPNFVMVRRVGGASPAPDTSATWPVIDTLAIGGQGFEATQNTYQRTERLALQFGPQDQASFDAMYALAQEWAA